jgi:hypothetical protein
MYMCDVTTKLFELYNKKVRSTKEIHVVHPLNLSSSFHSYENFLANVLIDVHLKLPFYNNLLNEEMSYIIFVHVIGCECAY